jgi:hypothetical protein
LFGGKLVSNRPPHICFASATRFSAPAPQRGEKNTPTDSSAQDAAGDRNVNQQCHPLDHRRSKEGPHEQRNEGHGFIAVVDAVVDGGGGKERAVGDEGAVRDIEFLQPQAALQHEANARARHASIAAVKFDEPRAALAELMQKSV